jgi:hypothetical protein
MSDDIRPVPDPTDLTRDAVNQAVRAAKDYTDGKIDVLNERLAGIDRATELLNSTVTRVPTEVQKEVGHLSDTMAERFHSVQTQFEERDVRAEREARDNTIKVDAAFAAQKEIAAKQDESNARAIEKSEKGTEKIMDGIGGKIDDLKERLGTFESRLVAIETSRVTTRETKDDRRLDNGQLLAILVAVVAIAGLVLAVTR